jgi:[ribosomal protein S18]-alanine N-acetyltransferase
MIQPAPAPELVRVDQGRADDLDCVMEIMAAAFDPAFGEAWTRPQCAGILPMTGVSLIIARADGVPAGFALFRTIAGESELLLIAVHPAHRRRGVGRKLLEEFIKLARDSGSRKVHLEVRSNNPAIALYSEAGFRKVGHRPDYYAGADGGRFDALTFARPV